MKQQQLGNDLSIREFATESEHGVLPLPPIQNPSGFLAKIVYRVTQRRYGKTPMAFQVIYARQPAILICSMVAATVLDSFLKIDHTLRFLLQLTISNQTGCTFCADLALADAVRAKIGREKFAGLFDSESSEAFSEKEKAAISYANALGKSMNVPDDVFNRLSRHFSEREMIEIVWVCAIERFFNSMTLPLRIGSDSLAG